MAAMLGIGRYWDIQARLADDEARYNGVLSDLYWRVSEADAKLVEDSSNPEDF